MDQDFVQQMKTKLLEMKQEIIENLIHEDEDFREIAASNDLKDLVDVASSDIDKKLLNALSAQDMKRLRLIDAALSRIENGKYGFCLGTGKPIPKERLEAIPYALYTMEYQAELDRRNR
ncbi:TraR/DksA family transcriptional regulator [Spirochaeta lutea]|uniref:Conjugal transfer protein TraR n=1 Tax=Spirochaeta lutea TaxID=1480694 RepID=A0A098R0G7_9SPIO|nr:TraR/DksA family transcriptional regulator [Spirochaeta lutea]KGE73429.1 conjugal transfer protein TraR [Spirochaeta lutea]